jgi:hypothetical protein
VSTKKKILSYAPNYKEDIFLDTARYAMLMPTTKIVLQLERDA